MEAEPAGYAELTQLLPDEAKSIQAMFPDLPVPAIQAALQSQSVDQVIEAALNKQIDVNDKPTDSTAPAAIGSAQRDWLEPFLLCADGEGAVAADGEGKVEESAPEMQIEMEALAAQVEQMQQELEELRAIKGAQTNTERYWQIAKLFPS